MNAKQLAQRLAQLPPETEVAFALWRGDGFHYYHAPETIRTDTGELVNPPIMERDASSGEAFAVVMRADDCPAHHITVDA